jgi:hypothetical protein
VPHCDSELEGHDVLSTSRRIASHSRKLGARSLRFMHRRTAAVRPADTACRACCLELERLPWSSPASDSACPRHAPGNAACRQKQLPWGSPGAGSACRRHAPCRHPSSTRPAAGALPLPRSLSRCGRIERLLANAPASVELRNCAPHPEPHTAIISAPTSAPPPAHYASPMPVSHLSG